MAHLTLEQRYKIESYRDAGKSITETADYIGKDRSIVSREIKRNRDMRSGIYKAKLADRKTRERHTNKLKAHRLNAVIEINILHYLAMDYSPEQMVGRAKIDGVDV